MDDHELLAAYASEHSEEAFAALVRRYLDLVYSAALRQLHNADQAQDVAQAVFLILARKANSISRKTILSGWLYRTARYVAREASRAENRRRIRESTMAELSVHPAPDSTEESWKRISPHLDHLLEQLSELDRTAILLRFFQGKSFPEIAAAFSVSEEAAKKRVGRALERLRGRLARRGFKDSTTVLGAALTAFAIQPAPAALATLIPSVVCQGTVTAASAHILMEGTIQMIAWTKTKTVAAGVAALLLTIGTTTVGLQNTTLARNHQRLQQEFQRLQSQSRQTETASQQTLAALQQENQQLRQQSVELFRLRNAVTQLRNAKSPRLSTAGPNKLEELPESLQQSAEVLRELQYERFVAAGAKALLQTPLSEDDRIKYADEINFMKNIGLALRIYATNHGDEFPENIEHLFGTGILQGDLEGRLRDPRYEYVQFAKAESKPGLPAVWWRAPDERGIRILVLNDGSAQIMREPVGVEAPGQIPGLTKP